MLLIGGDPAHGSYDHGMIDKKTGRREADVTLLLVKMLRDLQASKHTVILTRQSNDYVSLQERLHILLGASCDIVFTFHLEYNRDRRKDFKFNACGIYYLDRNREYQFIARKINRGISRAFSEHSGNARRAWTYPAHAYLVRKVPRCFLIRAPYLLTSSNLSEDVEELCNGIGYGLELVENRR